MRYDSRNEYRNKLTLVEPTKRDVLLAIDEVFREELEVVIDAWSSSWPMNELVAKLDQCKRLARDRLGRDERNEAPIDQAAYRALGRSLGLR